jgi:dTMP kinase
LELARRRIHQGFFIVFEGLDGAGKTTQLHRLAHHLQQQGYAVVCLKEPTEGVWGQKLRQAAIQGKTNITPEQELAWFLADRRDDVERNIRPALARGQIVLLDRYYFSTMAYQGARGWSPQKLQRQNEAFAPPPQLLFLLDIPPAQGLDRIRQYRHLDAFERLDYLERVAAIFANMDFPYLRRIQAMQSPETVHALICKDVQAALANCPHLAYIEGEAETS